MLLIGERLNQVGQTRPAIQLDKLLGAGDRMAAKTHLNAKFFL